jgi:hypothetical protein
MQRGSNFHASLQSVCAQDADVGNVAAVHAPFSADEAVAEIDATRSQRPK